MRYCFTGQVAPSHLGGYRDRHAAVWPEMLRALRDAGWGEYTLHLRDDGLLVGVVETPAGVTLEDARAAVQRSPVNARWQGEMAQLFDASATGGAAPDRSFTTLPTVFDLGAQLRSAEHPSKEEEIR